MTTTRKATARKPAARKPVARQAIPRPRAATTVAAPEVATDSAPPPGTIDLAGGLRSYLDSVEAEVRAVSALSEQIDGLVKELNDLREQQATRLLVLDQLRESVSDKSLGAFLDSAIRPRKTRIPEVVPDRLR